VVYFRTTAFVKTTQRYFTADILARCPNVDNGNDNKQILTASAATW